MTPGNPPADVQDSGVPRGLLSFFVLAFAISWVLWLPFAIAMQLGAEVPGWVYLPGVGGPMLGALVLAYRAEGRGGVSGLLRRLVAWRVGAKWYAAAIGIPFGVALLTAGLLQGIGRDVDLGFRGVATVVILLVVNTLLLPLEEVGWRGYALPGLQARFTALKASLILGAVWGVWHFPVFWIQAARADTFGSLVPSLALFVVFTVMLSVVFTWLYNNTRGSLLVACLFHGAVNAGTAMFALEGKGALEFRLTALVLGLGMVAGIVLLAGAADLSRHDRPTT